MLTLHNILFGTPFEQFTKMVICLFIQCVVDFGATAIYKYKKKLLDNPKFEKYHPFVTLVIGVLAVLNLTVAVGLKMTFLCIGIPWYAISMFWGLMSSGHIFLASFIAISLLIALGLWADKK